MKEKPGPPTAHASRPLTSPEWSAQTSLSSFSLSPLPHNEKNTQLFTRRLNRCGMVEKCQKYCHICSSISMPFHAFWLTVIGFPIISYYFGGCDILTPPQNNFPISNGSWTMSEGGREEKTILKYFKGCWGVKGPKNNSCDCFQIKSKSTIKTYQNHHDIQQPKLLISNHYQTPSPVIPNAQSCLNHIKWRNSTKHTKTSQPWCVIHPIFSTRMNASSSQRS